MTINAGMDEADPRPAYESPKVTTFDEATVAATLGPVTLTRSVGDLEAADPSTLPTGLTQNKDGHRR